VGWSKSHLGVLAVKKLSGAVVTIATLALTLAAAIPVASPVWAAPVLGTSISLPAGSGPRSVVFSPDGTKAYVANYFTSTVSVINVATDTLGHPISLPANWYPTSVAFSPDGSKAYVANNGTNTVSVIAVATGTLGIPVRPPQ
jgi:YVTN family beta-propeller protein